MKRLWILLFVLAALTGYTAPSVQFVVTSSTVNEGVGSFQIALAITNPDANPTSVDITVQGGGTATSGLDYTYTPVTLTFPANSQTVEFVTVYINDDQLVEGSEQFTFALNNPTNNATIGANATHAVTITDNDALSVGFVTPAVSQLENAGQVNVQIKLVTGNSNPTSVTVQLDAASSTSTHGSDFTFADTTITWQPDSSGIIDVPLFIVDDTNFEAPETVRLVLNNPTNGISLGTDSFTFTILNNDSLFLQNCSDLFFSEYEHGDADDKAMEIYNPTSGPVDMSEYRVIISYNGGDSTRIMGFSGTLASGDVYVFAKTGARPQIVAQADTLSHLFNWNGNDAIILLHNTDTIDVFGQPGLNPGLGFPMDQNSTWFNNYVRKKDVYHGDYYWSYGKHTWICIGTDVKDSLGAHFIYPCGSTPPKAHIRFIKSGDTFPESYTSSIPVVVEVNNLSENNVTYVVNHNNTTSTALFNVDYVSPVSTFTHAPGLWYDTVYMNIIDDLTVEPTETAVLFLTNLSGYGEFVADSTYTLSITDDDVLLVSFYGAGFSYVEDTNLVQVKLILTGPLPDTTRVRVTLAPGNATKNVDFRFNDTTVVFPANSIDTQAVWVQIINDTIIEPNEQINFNLTPLDTTLETGIIAYTLTIIDDDDVINGIAHGAWNNDAIKMYPNPATNTLTVECADVINDISVTDLLGNKIISLSEHITGKSTIDVSALPAGVYFVVIKQQQNTYTQRLIKAQ